MTMILQTEHRLGDEIIHATNPQAHYIVIGYSIYFVSTDGEALGYDVITRDESGQAYTFRPYEIENLTEKLREHERKGKGTQ